MEENSTPSAQLRLASHATSSSSTSSSSSSGGEEEEWYFRGNGGDAQGPFKTEQMRDWVKLGYLSSHAELSNCQNGPFAKLSNYFPDPEAAFQVGPRKVGDVTPDKATLSTDPIWYFKDKHGAIQGPFSENEMCEWNSLGYFDDSLQIRKGSGPDSIFRSLYETFPDTSLAFGNANYTFINVNKPIASPKELQRHSSNPSLSQQLKTRKQQSVKSKIFGRVSKHRRSNSAGSSVGNLVKALDNMDPPTTTSSGEIPEQHQQKSPNSHHSRSSSSFGSRKFATGGKKLLSVVTTPKYHGLSISKYGRSSKADKEASQQSSENNGGSEKSRRLPTFVTKSARYRQRRLRKKKKRIMLLRGEEIDGNGSDRTLDESDDDIDDELDEEIELDSSDSDDPYSYYEKTSPPTISSSDEVTEHIHTLLHSFRNQNQAQPRGALFGGNSGGSSGMSDEKRVQQLQSNVAELQDENGQLRAYIKQLESFATEKIPKSNSVVWPAEPPCLRKPMTGSSQVQQQNASAKIEKGREDEIWEDFIVVEFDEDSPMLRRKMSAFEEGIEALRGELKELVKNACGYVESNAEALDVNLVLADDLAQNEIRKLSPLISLLHEVLKVNVQLQENVSDTVHQQLIENVEGFLKSDMKQAHVLRRELQRTRDVYETLESKYMHHRRTKARSVVIGNVGRTHDTVGEQMFSELQAAKAKFELARFGLIQQINQLESKKRFVIVDGAASCVEAMLQYFRQGYQVMAGYSESLSESRAGIRCSRERFDVIVGKWNEKRIQLESQLHSGAFPFMSKERRMQNMSKAHEKVIVHSSTSRTSHDPLCIHEGYLYKRSSSVRKDWKRRWFVLRSDKLLYYRGWKDPTPQPVCDILLCTVREVKTPELRCCFEIISPNKRAYILQAVNEHEMRTWMDAIRKAIESTLTKQQQRPSLSRSSGLGDPEIILLLSLNPTCADCGAPNPDWVSLNLGALVCITCSGVHRSLGSHISKVRSLSLDRLPRSQIQLLRRLGNAQVNMFLEENLTARDSKPTEDSSNEEKRVFIHRKYVEKKYLRNCEFPPTSKDFFTAVEDDDLDTVLLFLLQGQSVDSHMAYPPLLPMGSTALHLAACLGHAECLELLYLNGACLNNINEDGETPFQLACRLGQHNSAQVLERLCASSGCGSSGFFDSPAATRRHSRSAPNSPVNSQNHLNSGKEVEEDSPGSMQEGGGLLLSKTLPTEVFKRQLQADEDSESEGVETIL